MMITTAFQIFILSAFLSLPWAAWGQGEIPDTARGSSSGPAEARILVFVSDECEVCEEVKAEVLTPLERKFDDALTARYLSIQDTANYDLLVALEAQFEDEHNDIPVVFIEDQVFGGPVEIRESLEARVEECLARGGCDFPSLLAPEDRTTGPEEVHTVYIAYFHRPGCKACSRVNYMLENLQRTYPNAESRRFDTTTKGNIELQEAIAEWLEVPDSQRLGTPSLVVGDTYLVEEGITDRAVRELIVRYQKDPTGPPWEQVERMRTRARDRLIERFRSLGPFAVIAAGLLDGINPCAFATILFFISYLALVGRSGRDLLYVGGAFTASVFLTYFLVGLGIFHFVQSLKVFSLISRGLYLCIAALAFVLGVLSLWDFLKVRRGEAGEMALQLPQFLKLRIHKTIREKTRTRRFVLAAFVAGVIVSLLELACTGQIYLPTICFVVGVPELKTHALAYLGLYNLMFIVPLAVVFGLTYFGTTSGQLAVAMKRHLGLVKLLTSLLFFGLCALLVIVGM